MDEEGELFDRVTGEAFVPRGVNLIRLSGGGHSTLDRSHYDSSRTEATFGQLASMGYNVVRVFLNSRPGGLPGNGLSISSEYVDNAVDLLGHARSHGLQVLFTQDWLPESNSWTFSSEPLIDNVNSMYLSIKGVEKNRLFFRQWASDLIARGAPMDSLLAYELRNELYFTELFAPFSLTSGTVTTANGRSYDLRSDDEKRLLLEENLVYWIDEMRAAIREVDPTALVTVGFFQPKGPNTSRVGDDRIIETSEAIANSTADFIDLHGYPGGELDLRAIVENYGLPPSSTKPILLGEFGAERGPYPTAEDAVRALVQWQVESCQYGLDGWLLWTWDSTEQPEFWNGLEADRAIGDALSPNVRPDPCTIGNLEMSVELATGATATASRALPESPAANAIDGLPDTIWNAGDDAPQWIEVDLGLSATVESIRLLVAQHPAGPASHQVTVFDAEGVELGSYTITGDTTDGDWLEVPLEQAVAGARHLRIETAASTSWIAWREISILGRS